jgi:hypothetical protein
VAPLSFHLHLMDLWQVSAEGNFFP